MSSDDLSRSEQYENYHQWPREKESQRIWNLDASFWCCWSCGRVTPLAWFPWTRERHWSPISPAPTFLPWVTPSQSISLFIQHITGFLFPWLSSRLWEFLNGFIFYWVSFLCCLSMWFSIVISWMLYTYFFSGLLRNRHMFLPFVVWDSEANGPRLLSREASLIKSW